MKFYKILASFEYDSLEHLGQSLTPSIKYSLTYFTASLACMGAGIKQLLGIGDAAFVALCVIMLAELISGLVASRIRGEKLSSIRWSRFGLKLGLWFIVLYVAHKIGMDFRERGSETVAVLVDWTHTALILNIFFEYLLSVLENISVISGKSNDCLIEKIRERIQNLL